MYIIKMTELIILNNLDNGNHVHRLTNKYLNSQKFSRFYFTLKKIKENPLQKGIRHKINFQLKNWVASFKI